MTKTFGRAAATTISAGALLALLAGTPPLPAPSGIEPTAAHAQATKSRGGGGSGANVSQAGERAGDLLSGWAVPVVIALAGCMLIGALFGRNVGAALGVVFGALLALVFLVAPERLETASREIANFIF